MFGKRNGFIVTNPEEAQKARQEMMQRSSRNRSTFTIQSMGNKNQRKRIKKRRTLKPGYDKTRGQYKGDDIQMGGNVIDQGGGYNQQNTGAIGVIDENNQVVIDGNQQTKIEAQNAQQIDKQKMLEQRKKEIRAKLKQAQSTQKNKILPKTPAPTRALPTLNQPQQLNQQQMSELGIKSIEIKQKKHKSVVIPNPNKQNSKVQFDIV